MYSSSSRIWPSSSDRPARLSVSVDTHYKLRLSAETPTTAQCILHRHKLLYPDAHNRNSNPAAPHRVKMTSLTVMRRSTPLRAQIFATWISLRAWYIIIHYYHTQGVPPRSTASVGIRSVWLSRPGDYVWNECQCLCYYWHLHIYGQHCRSLRLPDVYRMAFAFYSCP